MRYIQTKMEAGMDLLIVGDKRCVGEFEVTNMVIDSCRRIVEKAKRASES
jgi:hypothetical protein